MQTDHSSTKRFFRPALLLLVGLMLGVRPASTTTASTQTDLIGPAGSGQFGKTVTVLPNGNIVVTDPAYTVGAKANVGAVYLYNGSTHALISILTGSTANDQVGSTGFFGSAVAVLPNGNYVVSTPYWDNGAATDAGAVTWCSETVGCTGVVSTTNSLVGSTAGDEVGFKDIWDGVTVLPNGNYVVSSFYWDNGTATDAGAVAWCDGTAGCTGTISASNSLVGSSTLDDVGYGVTVLPNGNYVVSSLGWTNGAAAHAGAVTWCSGTAGCTGAVSASNSLVGSTLLDMVGGIDVTVLTNGNYVVTSPYWSNGAATYAGAVTWCTGTSGCVGLVSATNSLVGTTANDGIGSGGVTTLTNDNYVVSSPAWDNGAATNVGAVTWCSGTGGCTGVVSGSNSLTGTAIDYQMGSVVTALPNGNYVVGNYSKWWSGPLTTRPGAVTWCSGTVGCTGTISASNSLVVNLAGDLIGYGGVTVLPSGNYVVRSPGWTNGAASGVGAVTWCSGTVGCTGVVSTTNSLVGSTTDDRVGYSYYDYRTGEKYEGILVLTNGNYVLSAPYWTNGIASGAGAVTWCSGTAGCTGVVSASNSLVGTTAWDRIAYYYSYGSAGVRALTNGNYVVPSPYWINGTADVAGAVTWCSGTVGCTGAVSASNSLVGSTAGDSVGFSVTTLTNGNYVVSSPDWNNGTAEDAGAVTWCSGTAGCTGAVSAGNSLVGSTAGDSVGTVYIYFGVTALTNDNYVVSSPAWDNGAATNTGAVTWCSGMGGCTGAVSAGNSLVGSTVGDSVGYGNNGQGITALPNGNYAVSSLSWDNGTTTEIAGAVSWCSGRMGCRGPITSNNSVRGEAVNGGPNLTFAYDSVNDQLVVGRPADNRVTLFKIVLFQVYLPLIRR